MDGHFVPNLTIGPPVVVALRPLTKKPLDCHLMIEAPQRSILDYAKAGADVITVHVEACVHLHRVLQEIRDLPHHAGSRVQAGVSLVPHTPVESILSVLHLCDVILVMSVNPGFSGQAFIPEVRPKIRALRKALDERNLSARIEVDGGISEDTIALVAADGADTFVAGNGVFRHPAGYAPAIAALRAGATRARLS
jgi:ribulose-phosphate 3-epimerase